MVPPGPKLAYAKYEGGLNWHAPNLWQKGGTVSVATESDGPPRQNWHSPNLKGWPKLVNAKFEAGGMVSVATEFDGTPHLAKLAYAKFEGGLNYHAPNLWQKRGMVLVQTE